MSALLTSMENEFSKWKVSTTWYGVFYGTARTIVIFFSAVVAAQNNLKGSVAGFLVAWVPILALAVTILSAVEAWQEPQLKWRGFMEDRDGLESLIIRCKAGKEDEDKLLKEFEALRKKHRAGRVR